jgi:hypothetical protein
LDFRHLAHRTPQRPAPEAEPRLDDVLEGSATKALMEADNVTRRELDSIIRRLKDKLGRDN